MNGRSTTSAVAVPDVAGNDVRAAARAACPDPRSVPRQAERSGDPVCRWLAAHRTGGRPALSRARGNYSRNV